MRRHFVSCIQAELDSAPEERHSAVLKSRRAERRRLVEGSCLTVVLAATIGVWCFRISVVLVSAPIVLGSLAVFILYVRYQERIRRFGEAMRQDPEVVELPRRDGWHV